MEPMKPMTPMKPMEPMKPLERWWPDDLGEPGAVGSQDGVRYAFFPDARRLLVEEDGRRKVYATGEHRITGVAQSQGGTRDLTFTSDKGLVDLKSLPQAPG